MEIREIRYEDIDAAAIVYVESWQAGYRGLVPQEYLDALTTQRWAPNFRKSFGNANAPWGLVLCMEGEIVGVSHLSAARDEDLPEGYGEVISLYLRPVFWGKGLGNKLLTAALEELRNRGFTRAMLWTFRDNERARRAYLRAGFTPDGAEKEIEVGGEALPALRFTYPL